MSVDTRSDYTAEAERLRPCDCCLSCADTDAIAAALEAAHKRGRVEGLREAGRMLEAATDPLHAHVQTLIERRAEEVEQS